MASSHDDGCPRVFSTDPSSGGDPVKFFIPSVIDQAKLRSIVRPIFVFPLTGPSLRKPAIRQLRSGLQAILRQWPFLARQLHLQRDCADLPPAFHAQQSNSVVVRYTEKTIDVEKSGMFAAVELNRSVYPYTYADFLSSGGPTSYLKDEIFNYQPPGSPIPPSGLPVFRVRIKFIEGALVLCLFAHRSVLDATTLDTIVGKWAEHCRLAESTRSYELSNIQPQQLENLPVPSVVLKSKRGDPWELIKLRPGWNFPSSLATPPPTPVPLINRLFRFSHKHISDLRLQLQSSLLTNAATDVVDIRPASHRISMFVTLAALMWHNITRARTPRLEPTRQSRLSIGDKGRPVAVCKAWWLHEGACVIWPRIFNEDHEEPWEVQVCLAADEMERLCGSDGLWRECVTEWVD